MPQYPPQAAAAAAARPPSLPQVGVTARAAHHVPAAGDLPDVDTWVVWDSRPGPGPHALELQPGGRAFGEGCLNRGDEVRLEWEPARGALRVLLNGRDQGRAFAGIRGPVYPCVALYGQCLAAAISGQGPL
jgi:hypothetical protein